MFSSNVTVLFCITGLWANQNNPGIAGGELQEGHGKHQPPTSTISHVLDGYAYVYVHQTTPERFPARLMLVAGLPCNNLSVTEGKTWIFGGQHGYVAAEQIRKEYEESGEPCPDKFALVTYFPPSGRDRAQDACDVKQYVEGLHITFV